MGNEHSIYCRKPDIVKLLNISVKICWSKVWAKVRTNPNLANVLKHSLSRLDILSSRRLAQKNLFNVYFHKSVSLLLFKFLLIFCNIRNI